MRGSSDGSNSLDDLSHFWPSSLLKRSSRDHGPEIIHPQSILRNSRCTDSVNIRRTLVLWHMVWSSSLSHCQKTEQTLYRLKKSALNSHLCFHLLICLSVYLKLGARVRLIRLLKWGRMQHIGEHGLCHSEQIKEEFYRA